jgi:hypothetical protein
VRGHVVLRQPEVRLCVRRGVCAGEHRVHRKPGTSKHFPPYHRTHF